MVLAVAVPVRPAGAQSELPALTPTASEPAPAAAAGEPGWPKRFLRDVVGDYKHFVSVDSAVWLGVGGAGAVAVHAADSALSESAQEADSITLPGGEFYGSQWLHIPIAMAWWAVATAAGERRHAATGRTFASSFRRQLTYAVKLASDRPGRTAIRIRFPRAMHPPRSPRDGVAAALRLEGRIAGLRSRLHGGFPRRCQPALGERRRVRRGARWRAVARSPSRCATHKSPSHRSPVPGAAAYRSQP